MRGKESEERKREREKERKERETRVRERAESERAFLPKRAYCREEKECRCECSPCSEKETAGMLARAKSFEVRDAGTREGR